MKPRVLVVDEDAQNLVGALDSQKWLLEVCTDGAALAELVASRSFDVVLSDQDLAGLDALTGLLAEPSAPEVIVLKSFGSIQDAVECIRAGAADYLEKPTDPEQLRIAVERALERKSLRSENERLRADLAERYGLGRFRSRDGRMQAVLDTVRVVADARATLLIEGESGTGKTLLARMVHQASNRAGGPFVEVNCGALPSSLLESELFGHERGAFTGAVRQKAGKFELADGGTIFLDEIASAPPELQVKLLRVLQDRSFERVGGEETLHSDARVIAATNAPLRAEVAAGRFREDLFYRLNVVTLAIPPLRERPADVRLLAEGFLERFAAEHGRAARCFSPRAWAALLGHDWPGNVRELENAVERAVLLSTEREISATNLPPEIGAADDREVPRNRLPAAGSTTLEEAPASPRSLREELAGPEERILRRALERNLGNRKLTAAMLGVNRSTLFNKMRRYQLLDIDFSASAAPPDAPGGAAHDR